MKARSTLKLLAVSACWFALWSGSASAHDGRRFSIEVVDNRLQAQGVNSGADDGAPTVRPYVNSLHDHWMNGASDGASASLPGFDITPSAATRLLDHRLDLELLSVRKWVNPPMMPAPGTIPLLTELAPSQLISINGPVGTLDSDGLGITPLLEQITFGGVKDIDLVYEINASPQGEIHVLDIRLIASRLDGGVSSIAPSETVHVLLSPDGATPHERLHHASLFLESYIATVPEPATAVTATLAMLAGVVCRRPRAQAPR